MSVPTPHNSAQKGDIAKTVLMPGDPLRAKYIAETYLSDVKCFNSVRNMLGFTGKYKGHEVSVMGGGMGMPSVGIYTYELFNFYDVDNIIRIGSAGAYSKDLHVMDVVIAMGACTDSNYVSTFCLPGYYAPIADYGLLSKAVDAAGKLEIPVTVGNIVSSDVFYSDNPEFNEKWAKMGVLGVEMEAAGLYMNAARAGKKALCILTISDHFYLEEKLSTEERQLGFNNMMKIALETAICS
ncbi:MAG: purine-nucleoside phosphorylase [Lachnospiraceae bacterium]|nr:purine-nucleoside phosphorylase [Lachnospiraceae bacterium]